MKLTPISLPMFGTDINTGDKAIAVTANGSRRNADVIAAIQFRRYCRFKGIRDQSYREGICFYSKKGDRIRTTQDSILQTLRISIKKAQ